MTCESMIGRYRKWDKLLRHSVFWEPNFLSRC